MPISHTALPKSRIANPKFIHPLTHLILTYPFAMTITITELAELRLRTFLRGTPDYTPERGVRLAVKDGGCNGYEYDIKIANAPKPDDRVVESGSLKVFVDPTSWPLLDGIVVDYIDSLLESGFKFTNPNATATCGCGKSFQAAGDCSPTGVPCS